MTDALPAYSIAPEPELIFHGGRTDRHPLRGLIDHGPLVSGSGHLRWFGSLLLLHKPT